MMAKKTASDSDLNEQVPPNEKIDWLQFSIKVFPVLAVIIALLIVVGNLSSANSELRQLLIAKEKLYLTDLQTALVYSIIDSHGSEGIGFKELRGEYLDVLKRIEVSNTDNLAVSDLMLTAMLLELRSFQLVEYTIDEKYVANKSLLNPLSDRSCINGLARGELLKILSSESGKYTLDELSNKVTEVVAITSAEFHVIANDLIADKRIVIIADKVWTIASVPSSQEPNDSDRESNNQTRELQNISPSVEMKITC